MDVCVRNVLGRLEIHLRYVRTHEVEPEANRLQTAPPRRRGDRQGAGMTRRYRIRSRIVDGAPRRSFYAQQFQGYVDGRESWRTIARRRSETEARDVISGMMRLSQALRSEVEGIAKEKT